MRFEYKHERLGIRELYSAQMDLLNAAEAITWVRFNNYLVANSVLVVAWATIYGPADVTGHPLSGPVCAVLLAISALGVLGSLVWWDLGRRGREILDSFRGQIQQIEKRYGYWNSPYDMSLMPISKALPMIEGPPHWGKSRTIH